MGENFPPNFTKKYNEKRNEADKKYTKAKQEVEKKYNTADCLAREKREAATNFYTYQLNALKPHEYESFNAYWEARKKLLDEWNAVNKQCDEELDKVRSEWNEEVNKAGKEFNETCAKAWAEHEDAKNKAIKEAQKKATEKIDALLFMDKGNKPAPIGEKK